MWIKYAKKGTGIPSVTWTEAVDVALCYGWIDGQSRSIDDTYFIQRFTPRRPKSMWAKLNRERVARLIADGRMKLPGLVEVERAKADGRWDAAYDPPSTAMAPPDLLAALGAHRRAKAAFEALSKSERFSIMYSVQTAKKPGTRAKRIAAIVDALKAAKPKAKPKRRPNGKTA